MARERLLKRIVQWQDPKVYEIADISEGILRDIESLLNSQKGNVLIDAQMGMPDLRSIFHSHSAPEPEVIAANMVQQLSAYEPRISDVVCEFENNGNPVGVLRWKMRAHIQQDNEHDNQPDLLANIAIDMDGRVSVSAIGS